MIKLIKTMLVAVFMFTTVTISSSYAKSIRIALAEPPSDELAAFFLALDRAKANGLDYEWTAFSDEELAIQAVLSGQAGALSTVMYESLLGEGVGGDSAPADVYGESYCLLCERIEYPKTKDWVIFYMRPEARFSDGTPVTAHDIAFSHNLLLEEGLKSYADAVRKRIPEVEVIDDYTIKFYFTEGISRRSLIDQVGFVPAWSKKWYEETGAGLDESRLEISPGSGPYMVDSVDVNRRIVYKRNPDYWGNDLPFNKGRNNF